MDRGGGKPWDGDGERFRASVRFCLLCPHPAPPPPRGGYGFPAGKIWDVDVSPPHHPVGSSPPAVPGAPPRHFRALPDPEAVLGGRPRCEGGEAASHPVSCMGVLGMVTAANPDIPGLAPSGARCRAARDSQERGCTAISRRLMSCLPRFTPPANNTQACCEVPGGFASGRYYSSWSFLGQYRPRWVIWWPSVTYLSLCPRPHPSALVPAPQPERCPRCGARG